ncbi:MAG: hypothetical protein U9R48_09890 [Chloroflexota bacterium]|nr:hypothetical protein [Chloroflexota bacterium]
MNSARRVVAIFLAALAIVFYWPFAAGAETVEGAQLLDGRVIVSEKIPEPERSASLVVQATSWSGASYDYILSLTNLSPWHMQTVQVLDRYLPEAPEQEEIDQEWVLDPLAPRDSAAFVFSFPNGPLENGCHQIEISLAEELGIVLMDCNEPGAVTIWDVSLSEEVGSYLPPPPEEAPRIRAIPQGTLSRLEGEPTGPSKLGLHVTRNSSPEIMEFVREVHPAVIVAVGDVGWLSDVKKISPETITMGRFKEGEQKFTGDPQERARQFVDEYASRYLDNPGVDYWLGWNEPVFDGLEDVKWYAAFEAERTIAMAELGLRVAVGNFSAGTPEPEEFEAFLPALSAVQEHGGVLAVHEYSAPTMRDGVEAKLPGLEPLPQHGTLTLRYRYWYTNYILPQNLDVPLIVTEAGVDGGVLPPQGVELKGWRDFDSTVTALDDPLSVQTPETYLEQLDWYDDQLRRDPYVYGFALFNVGDSDGQWASFDMTEHLPDLAELVQSKG